MIIKKMNLKYFWFKQWDRELIFVLIFSFSIYLCGIWWGLPTLRSWAVDALDPQDILTLSFPKEYPPLQGYLLALLYLPLQLLDQWDLLETESLIGHTVLEFVGRFVSVVMSVGTVLFVYLTAKEIKSSRPMALFSALITALIVPLIYYAKTMNIEAPYIFWFALSLYFYIRIFKYDQVKDYFGFALTAIASVSTKDQAYALYLLPVGAIIWHYCRHHYVTNFPKDFAQKIILPVVAGITLYGIINNIFFDYEYFFSRINKLNEYSYEAGSFFERTENNLQEHLNLFIWTIRELIFSLSLPLFLITIAGVTVSCIRWRQNKLLLSLLIPAISYYLFFISVILYTRDRFMIPVCIVLSFFGGSILAQILQQLSSKWRNFFKFSIYLVFVYSFVYAFSINILMINDSRYVVEAWLRKNVSPDDKIVYVESLTYQPRLEQLDVAKTKHTTARKIVENLQSGEFDYIITTSSHSINRYPPGTEKYEAFEQLYNGKLDYQEVFRYKSQPKWNLLKIQESTPKEYYDKRYKVGNLNKINPEIRVFKKI